jgi:hypothetical protein
LGELQKRLEAAIGIEPMNKGFAVLEKLFAPVPICSLALIFVDVLHVSDSRVIAQI